MKPWEENWELTGEGFIFTEAHRAGPYPSYIDVCADAEYGKLVTASPELARMLKAVLESEYTGPSGYVGLGEQIAKLLTKAGVAL